MQIAVVILNWNGRKLLEQFLPSVIRYSVGTEIYVADNNSQDDSVDYLKQNFPSVQIVQNTTNGGFAKGYNDALKHIEADVYALINSDIEVTENWLVPIIEHLEQHSDTAIIQPKILDYTHRHLFEYAGAAGGFIDTYGYPFCRGRLFEFLEEDKGQYDDNIPVFWASGACFIIRKEVFDELHGFDEDFFAHQEEIDLCWRAFNKGYRSYYIGGSTVYHLGGATLEKGSYKKIYLNFRNSLFMLVKNVPKSRLFGIVFMRMVLDGLAGIRFLLKGEIKGLVAVLHAHFDLYCNGVKTYKKRDGQQLKNYALVPSIVKAYFIKGQKRFSELKIN